MFSGSLYGLLFINNAIYIFQKSLFITMQRLHDTFPNLEYLVPETYHAVTIGEFERNSPAIIPTLQILDPARRYNGLALVTIANKTGVWMHEGQVRIWDQSGTLEPIVVGEHKDLEHGTTLDQVTFLYQPMTGRVWLKEYELETSESLWQRTKNWARDRLNVAGEPEYSFR